MYISFFCSAISPTASYPIFTFAIPYTTDVFAPPYTFPYIVPPTMFTLLDDVFTSLSPVAAAFPPPNTHPLFGEIDCVVPSTYKFVFPYTTAVAPFPPAYKLPFISPPETFTFVFFSTIPSSPPPY